MVDSTLIDYIKDGLKKGYSKEELKQILRDNGWSNIEISEGFSSMDGTQPQQPSQPSQPKQTFKPKPLQQSPNKDKILLDFINKAFARGFSEDKVKQALVAKGWPSSKVSEIMSKASKPRIAAKPIETRPMQRQPMQARPQKPSKSMGAPGGRPIGVKILIYALAFILISAVLAVSFGVYYYINGIKNYTITDPNTGEQVTGYCEREDCSDMREYVFDLIQSNFWLILTLALSISLIIVLLHAFIPQKEWIVWIADILFFLYIIYLLVIWFLK